MTQSLPLSIVVAVTDVHGMAPRDALPDWFAALVREAKTVHAELLLAGDPGSSMAQLVAAAEMNGVSLHLISAPAASLTPQLWGLGLHAARGEVVAFTINQCTVQDGWACALLAGIAHGDAGVGGPLLLTPDTSRTGRAIYFLRYAAFLGQTSGARQEVRDIAGDNAAYRHDVLMRYGTYAHGFWEIEAHHWLRADGATLALVPGMSAAFGGSPRLLPFMRQRFAHGRHFGAWRVRAGGRTAWQIALVSPLVPFVLLLRTARRVAGVPGNLFRLAGCAGPFLALAAAWAAGETAGALVANSASDHEGVLSAN